MPRKMARSVGPAPCAGKALNRQEQGYRGGGHLRGSSGDRMEHSQSW